MEIPLGIAGSAGDASLVKQGYRICEKILRNLAIKEWGKKTLSFDQLEEAIGQIEVAFIR